MNEAGARREPFLFGVDFELSEGFFVSDPLGQQELLFEAGGVTNSPVGEGMPWCGRDWLVAILFC